ncbi:cytochrome d ubiquinol oxidase subunit II [Dactylosporangium sp. AC04546]|uniref:cytochrome d ubiquinol oxidase subunit II n=1 Tax=Dactylosporangium sp. AC04546 TaxID=2862460 RepID=UPI001EDF3DF2|nr:cytochrome d ubiquinol oxidase subunit II [Dactylosporangium sp. AC04546]WVK85480.1 cytochrome d ubiquinol oxidase subunit II [Dactylosporangium sp. AC04546]
MSSFWYAILGVLLVAYFALGGLDQGVAMLLATIRGNDERRRALNAIGPMFLGNEVWIVGAIGVLVAAFPRVEGELFGAAYPVIAVTVLALLLLNASVQLRSRGRRSGGFDLVITVSGVALALGWGLLLGVLLHGAPVTADGHVHGFAPLADPLVWATGVANVLLVLTHGAAFLSWRLADARMRRTVRWLGPVAAGVVLLVAGGWWLSAPDGIRNPLIGTLLAVATAVAVGVAGRFGFAATLVACALPVLAVASALYPTVLASTVDPGATVTVDDAAAGGDTLRLLAFGAAPLLPVLVAVQVSCWWLFRQRERVPTPLYW